MITRETERAVLTNDACEIEINPVTGLIATPFFLVASERSGTTLMSVMFDHHPQIAFLNAYFCIERLVDESDWPDMDEYYKYLETDFVFQNCGLEIDRGLNYPHLADSFLRQHLTRSGKPIVGAKIRDNFHRVLRLWPDARFIHLIRDGRDVAHSIIGMGWAGNMYTGADHWLRAEKEWARVRKMVSPDRYIEIRYEDLVTEPRATLEQICEFLELPYDSAMLDYPNDTTYSTPSPSSIGQWRRKLTPDAIRLAEAHIGEKLTALGYELSGREPMTITPAMQKKLWRQDYRYRLMFRRKRCGTLLLVADYVTRRFGPRFCQVWIQNRIHKIERRYLK